MSADSTKPMGKLDYLETLPGESRTRTGEEAPLAYGGRIGRHLILDTLGQGGMGIVYAAYDPVLDRRIAVKLMIRDAEDPDASDGRARMQREAQALARLSHANVITVHDVGEADGSMYIAMEIVDGANLRVWQKGKPWRSVMATYLAAARGLAAAHSAGLVHRDFKPDNVLVGTDGRVRVTDFGLARRAGDLPPAAASEPASPSAFDSDLTAAGAVMGTLAYMAPEQIDGAPVDARSDQCSWCIAAWEAIYGDQPFVIAMPAIRSAAMQTDVPKPPAKTAVPRAVQRALVRGMLPKAADRWPDMAALVGELERAMSPRRVVIGGAAFAGIAVIATVFAIGKSAGSAAQVAPKAFDCASAGAPAAALWTAGSRADLERAFVATGAPYAADASTAVERNVLAWRTHWQQVARESCEATHVQGTQTPATGDLRTACLVQKRDELATVLAAMTHADRARVEAAPMTALPELEACSDPAALSGAPPPPKDAAARAAIETALGKIEAEVDAGLPLERAKALRETVRGQVAAAEKLGWSPLTERARRDLSDVERELGHGKEARSALVGAAADASAAGEQDELVDIYANLADLEARVTSDFGLGEDWLALGTGTLARMGPRPRKQRKLATARGVLLERRGDLDDAHAAFVTALPLAQALGDPPVELKALLDLARVESSLNQLAPARDHLARAQALAHATVGDKHPLAASILHDLGTVTYREGRYADALDQFHAALAIREAAYGKDSAEYGRTLQVIGNTEVMLDRFEDARAHFEDAIRILSARLGPEHPEVADALNDIGGTYHRAGHYAEALAQNQKVLAIREKVLGKDHPDVAESLVNVAIEAKNLGKWDLVDANYPRAIAIYETKLGKDSFEIAVTMINLGEARRMQGRFDEARAAYERTRAILTKQLGPDHPMLAHVWNGEGQLELAAGHRDLAIPLLEKAVAIRAKEGGDATDLAESRFALARALPPDASARAIELAKQALPVYRGAGPGYAKRADEIDAWLARVVPR